MIIHIKTLSTPPTTSKVLKKMSPMIFKVWEWWIQAMDPFVNGIWGGESQVFVAV